MAFTTLANIYKASVAPNVDMTGNLIKKNGLMGVLPFSRASHGNEEKFQLDSTDGTASITNSGSGIILDAVSDANVTVKLAMIEAGIGSDTNFIDSRMPIAGQTAEQSFFGSKENKYVNTVMNKFSYLSFYGDNTSDEFDGMLQVATDASAVVDKGADALAGTDIFVIRFDEAGSEGLYNGALVDAGQLIKFTLDRGVITNNTAGTGVQRRTIGTWQSALGFKTQAGYVSAITGIDATHKPTIADFDSALMTAGAYKDRANTVVLCSAYGYTVLQDVLGDSMKSSIMPEGTVNTLVDMYNGSRVIIDDAISNAR